MSPCRFLVLALWSSTWQSTCRRQQPRKHIRQPFPLLLLTAPTDYGRRMARASSWLLRAEAGPAGWTAKLSSGQGALQLCGASPDLSGGRLRYARARIGKSQNGNGELRQESTPLFILFPPFSCIRWKSNNRNSLRVMDTWSPHSWVHVSFFSLCVFWKHYYKWQIFI